jgi:lipoprotein-anchoring transpeptidase ErfK/SrfK
MGTMRPRRLALAAAVGIVALELVGLGASADRTRAAALLDPPIVELSSPASAAAAGPTVSDPAGMPVERDRSPAPFLLVAIERSTPVTARPGGRHLVGTMPEGSRFYGVPTVAWVRRVSPDGRFGLVDVPYVASPTSGWIELRGLDRSRTRVSVVADLSARRVTVRRGSEILFRTSAAVGAPASPTPVGRYFVTDRVSFPVGGLLGSFAFGISGIQPALPAGWSGGDQLAIHGTNAPSSIGRAVSAGCLRVSERALARLRPLLRLGTPVIVRA